MSAVGGVGMGGMSMPMMVSGASMRMPPEQKMNNLFQQIDTGNTGSITKSQFEQAFQTLNPPPSFKAMGADAIFSKLDSNNTGSVSKQDFINGMKPMMTHRHHGQSHHAQDAANAAQMLANSTQALNAAGNAPPPPPPPTGAIGNNVNTKA